MADIGVRDGKFAAIGDLSQASGGETFDARGLTILPGVIDSQVHFREPGREHKEDLGSGSRAAVKGGVTSFLEMPNTDPPTINQSALDDKLRRAAEKWPARSPARIASGSQIRPLCESVPILMINRLPGHALLESRGGILHIQVHLKSRETCARLVS